MTLLNIDFGEEEYKKGLYIPIGSFITAYARNKTIRTSQAIRDYSLKKYKKDLYIYSDTDSCHTLLSKEDLLKICDIDEFRLGAWKIESSFIKGKFIRQKTYIEKMIIKCNFKKYKRSKNKKIISFKLQKIKLYYTEINITCAGLPSRCYNYVTFENFKEGFKCSGKLMFSHVKGRR